MYICLRLANFPQRIIVIMVCIKVGRTPFNQHTGCKPPHFEEASYPADLIPQWTDINGILRFRCDEKYKDIETYTKCTGNDQWESLFPPCELVICEIPEKPPHSNYTVVTNPGVGDTITYSCEEGWRYTGTSTRVCERNGKLNGVPGKCEEIQCPEIISDGDGELTLLPPYRYNDKVSIKCREGYSSNEIRCQADSSWSATLGPCIEEKSVNCTKPQRYTQMTFDPDQEIYPYNSTVKVTCPTGYYYSGSTHYWNCTIQSLWSGSEGICQAVHCDRPTFKIENGSYNECESCPYNTRLEVNCMDGYTVANVQLPRCDENGQWINTNAICQRKTCGPAPSIENGLLSDDVTSSFELSREVFCNEGYENDRRHIHCQINGKWSNPGKCTKIDIQLLIWSIVVVSVGIVLVLMALTCFLFICFRKLRRLAYQIQLAKGHRLQIEPEETVALKVYEGMGIRRRLRRRSV